jgi:hypothetical protein
MSERPDTKDPWLEFVVEGFCGLCANHGFVGPLATETPAGKLIVMSRRPCICPNGRSMVTFTIVNASTSVEYDVEKLGLRMDGGVDVVARKRDEP